MFKSITFALALATASAAPFVGAANAAVGMSAGEAGQISLPSQVEKAQFVPFLFGGRNYCWYDAGWRGPGWYWCGYAYRSGLGWGGGDGWNGWRRNGGGGRGGMRHGGGIHMGGGAMHMHRGGGGMHMGGGRHGGGGMHMGGGRHGGGGGGHRGGGHGGGRKH